MKHPFIQQVTVFVNVSAFIIFSQMTFYYCKAVKLQNCLVNVVLHDEVGEKGQQKRFSSKAELQFKASITASWTPYY